jgi:alpha-N-acetylglucosaminidase
MQGWLFRNDPSFWKEPEISAFLGAVPDDRMILLDLACDQAEIWRQSAAFRRKPYIWNLLHGFGGATPLFGDLSMADQKPIAAQTDPNHGSLIGMGITMEGIQENSAMYELMCDSMWRSKPVDASLWMTNYFALRWDVADEIASPIADAIRLACYTDNEGGPAIHYQDRPGLKAITKPSADAGKFRSIVESMLKLPESVQKMPLFHRDLVDVAKRYAAEKINDCALACLARGPGHEVPSESHKQFDNLMADLDQLLDTVPQYRLSAWISDARRSGGDGDLLENNARMQLTVWGGPILNDYAAKEWSGLVGDFYRQRWDRFFDAFASPDYTDATFQKGSADWELQWCSKTNLPRILHVDPIVQVKKILDETR